MARAMTPGSAKRLAHAYFEDFLLQRAKSLEWDAWARGEQEAKGNLYIPKDQTRDDEYDDLIQRSPTPWISLIITAMAQTAFQSGIHAGDSGENMQVWETFQQNRWDSRQNAVWRGALSHGVSYVSALPGRVPLTGASSAVLRGYSALSTVAWYEYADDEWPQFVIHAEQSYDVAGRPGWTVELYDEVACYRLLVEGDGENLSDWTPVTVEDHDLAVSPFVRFTNMTDLDGRHRGEVEPFIPLAKRIDQDAFDRLIVQRFGAWKVRYITGLVRPPGMSDATAKRDLMAMKVNDFLVATSDKTQFGTLDATDLKGFIEARDADLRDFSAVTQTPPHQILGLTAQMQPESLSAARAGLQAKSFERRTNWGESTEQLARLTAKIRGNPQEMTAYDMEVTWKDTEVRPLSQMADALGKLASQVGVPQQMLFEMIPDWTDNRVKRAMELVESGQFDQLVDEFTAQLGANDPAAAKPAVQKVP